MGDVCNACNNKLNFDIKTSDLYNFANKTINLTDIHLLCDDCFCCDSYIDLMKILNQYEQCDINFIHMKIFFYDGKFFILNYEWKEYLKNNSKELQKHMRNITMNKILRDNKMTNKKTNLCNAYIKFGNPSIEHVLDDIHKNQSIINNRLYELIQALKNHGKEYDENLPIYKNYIKYGGNIDDVINECDLEKLFVYNTKYLHYLKHNNLNVARYLSITEFINSGKKHELVQQFITNVNTINFY